MVSRYTPAHKKASIKWRKKTLERFPLDSKIGFKAILKQNADSLNMSSAQFIKNAVNEYSEKHGLSVVFADEKSDS